jgi:hypothetical protein
MPPRMKVRRTSCHHGVPNRSRNPSEDLGTVMTRTIVHQPREETLVRSRPEHRTFTGVGQGTLAPRRSAS